MKPGSDCPTGKEQWTRAGARGQARWWRQNGDRSIRPFRCMVCGCWHLGHLRRQESKRKRGALR